MENRLHPCPVRGFTLLEMMITVAAVGILLAIGVPSFRYIANANRIAAEANNLLGDLQFARSEAIKEGQSVSVCASADVDTSSTPTCLATGGTPFNWATGWIVFSDGGTTGTIDGNDVRLRASNALSSRDSFVNGAGTKVITFNREGFAAGLAGTQYFTLHAPTAGNDWTRCVTVNLVGMTSVVKYDGANCT